MKGKVPFWTELEGSGAIGVSSSLSLYQTISEASFRVPSDRRVHGSSIHSKEVGGGTQGNDGKGTS